MLFKNVDEKLKEIGFIKQLKDEGVLENRFGVCYRRPVSLKNKDNKYIQRLDVCHKSSGKHLIQSYQEGVNSDGFNNSVGLTYYETKLVMKKYRQLKRKYKW